MFTCLKIPCRLDYFGIVATDTNIAVCVWICVHKYYIHNYLHLLPLTMTALVKLLADCKNAASSQQTYLFIFSVWPATTVASVCLWLAKLCIHFL